MNYLVVQVAILYFMALICKALEKDKPNTQHMAIREITSTVNFNLLCIPTTNTSGGMKP